MMGTSWFAGVGLVRRWLAPMMVGAVLLSGCGSSGSPNGETGSEDAEARSVIVLVFVDGELDGGVRRESVSLGETATLLVQGSVDDLIHVHGYDLYLDPEIDSELTFDALIPGRFEVELERSGQLLFELTVS